MKALIIYRVDISDIANRGVSKKMQGQIWGLVNNGYEVDNIYLSNHHLHFNEKQFTQIPISNIRRNWFLFSQFYTKVLGQIDAKSYDLILIRFHALTPDTIRFLEAIKRDNPKIRVIFDMPTYPYDPEFSGIIGNFRLAIDKRNRKKLTGKVDQFLHYGSHGEIFGIPCINITNGILPINTKPKERPRSTSIRMIAVGKWQYWHGLDRLLYGLVDYNKSSDTQKLFLDIVGEGPDIRTYKEIVATHQIEGITFHGPKSGAELEELYSSADVGIGTLAIQRKGVEIDSSLKHREYCMRGLPFILGNRDLDFSEDLSYVKYFSGDGNIDIEELIEWKGNIVTTSNEIHEYALENLSWENRMKKITSI